ncbi:MAG TPA: HAMP domain-containing sensor histidine kinase [Ilumatobacteraceae bacterium]|nr:HAMP domain-containing sensor histidine kinase [Ilumatobacteraceae bacterium]
MALRRRGQGRERVAVALGGLVVVALVGFLDFVTPMVLSLAVLYVLVVVMVTLLSGLVSGIAAAAASSAAWVVGDSAVRQATTPLTFAVNGALRSLALALVALLVERLVRALTRARESDRQSREFLATAAHQLRTPIAGLRASADALLCVEASPRQEQLLANLANEAARAGRLIGSLLRVARLDQGESLSREVVDLRHVVIAELDRARHLCSLDLRFSVTAEDGPVVAIDVQATRDAFANLLDNARRHALRVIDVVVERNDDEHLDVVVRDDGPGLPAGLEERVFERFVSLDGCGGSGLGLPIARELARRQGGELTYRDGAFVLTLPTLRGDGSGESRWARRSAVDSPGGDVVHVVR